VLFSFLRSFFFFCFLFFPFSFFFEFLLHHANIFRHSFSSLIFFHRAALHHFFLFIQHTPVRFTGICVSEGHIEYLASHPSECRTLKWLVKEIRQHIFCRTICNLYFPSFNAICNKIITHIQVFSMLTTGHLPIL